MVTIPTENRDAIYGFQEPEEDYTKNVAAAEDKKTTAPKLTPAQKKLAACDKTGMKNIASFFGKKK